MTPNPSVPPPPKGLHVGAIMDGNGRWATGRGLPRMAGHRAGVETVSRIVEGAPSLGIGTLTLYAFSSDNWQRPSREVNALIALLGEYIRKETDRCVRNGVRVGFIGRRDRLGASIANAIDRMEKTTQAGRTLDLRLAVDYSSRDSILRAARLVGEDTPVDRESFLQLMAKGDGSAFPVTEVDLLVRTGGEQRLSDFLLWECAYAELHFTARLWPDFELTDLEAAVTDYHARERRFGRVPDAAAG